MLDFNSKKEILGRLRRKGQKNIFMFVPCTIAAFFVKAWYAFICRADMALSDKNGDLLGIKGLGKKEKDRSRKDDIVYVRKPFLGRFVSAVLAMSLTMMLMPAVDLGLGIDTSAVDTVIRIEQWGYVPSGVNGYYFLAYVDDAKLEEYRLAEELEAEILSVTPAYKSVKVTWKRIEEFEKEIDYVVGYSKDNDGRTEIGSTTGNEYVFGREDDEKLVPNSNYRFYVIPRTYLDAYEIETIRNEDGSSSYRLTGNTRRLPLEGNVGRTGESDFVRPNKTLSQPSNLESNIGTNYSSVELTWEKNSVDENGNPADGYVVYRSEFKNGKWTDFEYIDKRETTPLEDRNIVRGSTYQYYVMAYKDIFSDSGTYVEHGIDPEAGMIISMHPSQGTSGKVVTVSIPPLGVSRVNVTSDGKNTLNISWNAMTGRGNVDGYEIYRTVNTEITEKTLDELALTSPELAEKYKDEVTNTWNLSEYIKDNAEFLGDTDQTNWKDPLDPNLMLTNDDRYYYYVIPYVNDGKTNGATHLRGPSCTGNGVLGAQVGIPMWVDVISGDGNIELKWKDNDPDVDGYKIYIKQLGDKNGKFDEPKDLGFVDVGNVTSWTHEQLYNHDEFEYQIEAYYNNVSTGENETRLPSKKSDPRTAIVNVVPDVPQNIKVETRDGEVTVSWDPVAGAVGYKLVCRGSNGYNETFDNLKETTKTITGLKNGEVISFEVSAYKMITGERIDGKASTPVSIKVGLDLKIPQDVAVETEDGETTVTWSDVNGAEGYILQYRRPGESWADYKDSSDLHNVDLSDPGFNHTRLNNGDTYEYRVIAYKTVSGERVYSEPSIIVSIKVGDILDAPKDFAVTTTDGTANLTWTESDGAEGYMVYAYSAKDRRMYSYDVSQPGYNHTNLINGDTWIYYVVAYKTVNGERTYSPPTISISVNIGVSMTAAVDLTATPGNRQVVLNWSAVTGAQGYVVYLYNEVTMEYDPITVTSQTTYTHLGLTNGKNYRYMVAAYKDIGGERVYGEYSMPVTATPTTGSLTDIDRDLTIKGTAPYGISHGEYISASANHGAFDESVDVYFTTSTEATQTVRDVLKSFAGGLNSFIIYPFDISVYSENTKVAILPNNGYNVTITMPIPDRLIAYRDYISIVHIDEYADEETIEEDDITVSKERRLEVLPSAVLDIDNVWCVQFETSSFSPYAMVIYKDHISDIASGGGSFGGLFAGSFNSGVLLFTALPDIMPNNNKLRIVSGGQKRYRIKSIEKLTK